MGIYIEGFGIAGYRSFGKNVQRIGPLSKINIFAGQNNSGKSNILNYLMNQHGTVLKELQTKGKQNKLDELDVPMKDWDNKSRVDIGIIHNGEYYKRALNHPDFNKHLILMIEDILKSNVLCGGSNISWIPFEFRPNKGYFLSATTIDDLAASVHNSNDWYSLWN